MKIVLSLFLAQALSLVACQPSASPGQPQPSIEVNQSSSVPVQENRKWRAATFQGLTMGKSTRGDMLRVLGKPVDAGPDSEGKELGMSYVYRLDGEIPGELLVRVDDAAGVIFNAEISPRNLSKQQAIKYLGADYIVTRYNFDDCLGDGESAPLYESPIGNAVFIEYRERGIALLVDEHGTVNDIRYVSEPVGARSSRCQQVFVAEARRHYRQTPTVNQDPAREWRAATYRGLTVGQSTQAEMLKIFGKPQKSEPGEYQAPTDQKRIVWNKYEGIGEYPGEFIVEVDESSRLIVGMFQRLRDEEYIFQGDAIKRFGKDYFRTRYDLDECENANGGEDTTLFESPTGPFLYLEYRSRGIAIFVDSNDSVRRILYLNQGEPLGTTSSRCKQ